MDATGASTSTGRGAGPPEVTGSAGDATAAPPRPVGRADATGPLPVQVAPADPTGPLPAPQPGSWFDPGAAADTTAQPVVAPAGPPPSWFATGPLPVVPTDQVSAAPPDAATPPAGEPAPPNGPPADPVQQSVPAPASLFEPAAGPPPTVPAPTPPTAAVPVVGPPPPADPPPPTAAIPVTGPPPADPAPPAPADPGPPIGAIPVVGPPPPADPPPPTATIPVTGPPPADPAPPAPAGLFTPATPPAAGAPVGSGAPADLFTPATPPQAAPPVPPEPPTGLFAAVAPPPTAPPPPPPPPPPAGPARPADATGPIPVVGAAVPTADVQPPLPPSAAPPPPPAPEAAPRSDSWSFAPDPTPPARPDSWSPPSDDRRPGDPPSRPLPTATGGGHSNSLTMVSASNTATKPAKRRAWPLTVVGVLVAVAAGIALVFSVARSNPADLAAAAASDAGSWPGAHYQGAVAANDGGEIRFDLTVTSDGASGTLSRDGGQATAELLWDQGGALIRANREWWLYHHPTRADDLAGAWVAEPATETREIDPILHLNGGALADYVRGEQPSRWQALEQQLVEGRSGIVLFDGARRVVVGSEDAHPLLALDVAPNANTPPVPVSRPTEEQVAAVTGAAARVRQEAGPKTLAQLLEERPNVGIQLQPDPLCTAQTCNVTVTVNNSGTAPARGRLEVSADGKVVANHPLDVQPGQVATFTASAPNPQFAQPGATGRILWETRAVDD